MTNGKNCGAHSVQGHNGLGKESFDFAAFSGLRRKETVKTAYGLGLLLLGFAGRKTLKSYPAKF
jgi:hypothetical protein